MSKKARDHHNLLITNSLLPALSLRDRTGPRNRMDRSGSPLTTVVWPPVRVAAGPRRAARITPGAFLALSLAFGAAGCAHSSAPCPTPPATLDAHRSQSESLQRDLAQVSQEAESLDTRRQEAFRRIQAAKAIEDSLARTSSAPAPKKARPR